MYEEVTALSASCYPSITSTVTGIPVTWTVAPTGGDGSYTYSWSGDDGLTGTTSTLIKTYTTLGTKTASMIVSSGGSSTEPIACTSTTI